MGYDPCPLLVIKINIKASSSVPVYLSIHLSKLILSTVLVGHRNVIILMALPLMDNHGHSMTWNTLKFNIFWDEHYFYANLQKLDKCGNTHPLGDRLLVSGSPVSVLAWVGFSALRQWLHISRNLYLAIVQLLICLSDHPHPNPGLSTHKRTTTIALDGRATQEEDLVDVKRDQ